MRALIRRPANIKDSEILTAYHLILDTNHRQLTYHNRSVILTQKECDMIAVFIEQPEKTHTRNQLLWRVWGGNTEVENGNIDNYIHFLRKRLRELNCNIGIKTIYGAGYRLEVTK